MTNRQKRQRDEVAAEWRRFVGWREPCIEHGDDVIYFKYNKDADEIEFGASCNTGILRVGGIQYDHGKSMTENVQDAMEEAISRYDSNARIWCVNDPTRKCVCCEMCGAADPCDEDDLDEETRAREDREAYEIDKADAKRKGDL